jgi:uncharacterized SAM-binding protein YcdF (DUF218 family)
MQQRRSVYNRVGVIRSLIWIFAILALAFTLTALSIALTARRALNRADPPSAPLVVVLGAGTAADGTLGARTIPRFERGLSLVEDGIARAIHFTGGEEHRGITEGTLMAQLAAAHIPKAAITFEGRSRNTLQNALFTVDAIGRLPDGSILVSDPAHLFRARASFKWAGAGTLVLVAASASGTAPPDARKIINETAALWLNAGRAAAFSLASALGASRSEAETLLLWPQG